MVLSAERIRPSRFSRADEGRIALGQGADDLAVRRRMARRSQHRRSVDRLAPHGRPAVPPRHRRRWYGHLGRSRRSGRRRRRVGLGLPDGGCDGCDRGGDRSQGPAGPGPPRWRAAERGRAESPCSSVRRGRPGRAASAGVSGRPPAPGPAARRPGPATPRRSSGPSPNPAARSRAAPSSRSRACDTVSRSRWSRRMSPLMTRAPG